VKSFLTSLILLSLSWSKSACTPAQTRDTKTSESQTTAVPTVTITPDWFNIELTDVQTGETFSMNDYAGKVVLAETMAIWCPNCLIQATQVGRLHEALGNPEDLISVTMDVDSRRRDSVEEYA
jgi:thiol-disulfide isomerase/thioredoxin